MSLISRLFGSVMTYALANVLNSAIPFFLLPILTRVLSPEQYGLVTIFTSLMAVFSVFTGLNLHGAVSVRYFDKETNHPSFVGACFAVLAASTTIVLFLVWVLSGLLTKWTGLPVVWLLAAVLASALQTVIYVRLVMWQVKGDAAFYGLFQICQTLVNLGLSLWLILKVGMNWEGRVIGIVGALLLFGILAFFNLQRSGFIDWRLDRPYVQAALRFGVPLVPHSIGGMMMAMSDRFVVTALAGLGATGAYAVGAQVGMVVGLLADSFNKAYGPHLLRELQGREGKVDVALARQCLFVFAGFLGLALFFVVLVPLVYMFFVGEKYQASLLAAQWVGFGNAFLGMYYVVSGFVFYSEKTWLLSRLTLICGLVNVLLTYLLVGLLSAVGAAVAYCIVQILFFCGALHLSQKVCPIPWRDALCSLGKNKKCSDLNC